MNFLELCQKVNLISGIQGSITDTNVASGIQGILVEAVRNGWLTIQNHRKDWTFMLDNVEWSTVADQEVYTPAEVFASHSDGENLGHYVKGRMMYEYTPLRYIHPYSYPLIDNTSTGPPDWYTIESSDNRIWMNTPNDSYVLTNYYWKQPQVLTASTDIPDLPDQYHDILIYKGIELFAIHIGNSELYQTYSKEYHKQLGVLMRTFLPSREVYLRGGIA